MAEETDQAWAFGREHGPHLTPAGPDEFVGLVAPELRDRGSFRTEYTGATLRVHLGLRRPHHRTTVHEGARAS